MNNNIKYPFPTSAILLFISSFFYFFTIVFVEELPYAFADFILPALIRFFGVIALGVFLLVKRLPIANIICISSLFIAHFAEMVNYLRVGEYYLNQKDTSVILFKDLLILITLIFMCLLAITNITKGSFKKFSKVWFIGIILSVISYLIDFFVMINYIEHLPNKFENIIMFNVFGNIFLCIALCLVSGWFKKVADIKNIIENEVYVPQIAYVIPTNQSVYTSPVSPVKEAPEKIADDAQELRKYKNLLDEGIITQEDFDKKKQQILNI